MNRLKNLKSAPTHTGTYAPPSVLSASEELETADNEPAISTHDRTSEPPDLPGLNPKSKGSPREPCYTVNLGLMDYSQAWELQSSLVAARINGSFDRDTILFLEHPAVFTLGRRGGREYLQVDEGFLKEAGIPIVQAERGGYITYHGPGQLVVYPIIDLHARRLGVPDFVTALEDIMLQAVRTWGIRAQRNKANAGIWMGNHKMGSIGIALRKGISFHGLALNVNVDLTPFYWIEPCGLKGISMTSVQQELGREIPMRIAVQTVRRLFDSVLGFDLYDISYSELKEQL